MRIRSPSEFVSGVFPVVGKGQAGAAGKESFRCCKAHVRGRASDRADFTGERDHRAVEVLETFVAISPGILKTES